MGKRLNFETFKKEAMKDANFKLEYELLDSENDTFAHTITSTYGNAGKQWLVQLPTLIEQCTQLWNLTDLTPYPNLTYNYVLSGKQNGIPIVLKLRCDQKALEKEIAALQTFNGYACVKILAFNKTLGAILLEQIVPGTSLASLVLHDDANATSIAANLIQRLHQEDTIDSAAKFPTLEQILPTFDKELAILTPFLAQARILREQLLTTQSGRSILLHGDFHHDNILLHGEKWRVIDPEGIIGDSGYDLAVFIRNPLKQLINMPNAKTIILNRINDFAQLLGYDAARIYDWTYLQTVTSAYWSIEDGLDATNHVKFLNLLEDIKKDDSK